MLEDGRVIGMISFNSARELGGRDPLRPADAVILLEHVLVAHPTSGSTRSRRGWGPIVRRSSFATGSWSARSAAPASTAWAARASWIVAVPGRVRARR